MWHRVQHRVAQFFEALIAPFQPIDEVYVKARLEGQGAPAKLWALFRQMPRAEQVHGIRTCRALERCGFTDQDLLAAALLHDVGKLVAPPSLWARILVVLIEHFAPSVAARWYDDLRPPTRLRGLRRAFVVRRYHPAWGAALAEEAGASVRTVTLIRQHHRETVTADSDAELVALQAADEERL